MTYQLLAKKMAFINEVEIAEEQQLSLHSYLFLTGFFAYDLLEQVEFLYIQWIARYSGSAYSTSFQ